MEENNKKSKKDKKKIVIASSITILLLVLIVGITYAAFDFSFIGNRNVIETGDISIAIDGILRKYEDIAKFKEDLEKIIGNENSEKIENAFMQNIWKLRKK